MSVPSGDQDPLSKLEGPYSNRDVTERVLWGTVNHLAGMDWRAQKMPQAMRTTQPAIMTGGDTDYWLRLYALQSKLTSEEEPKGTVFNSLGLIEGAVTVTDAAERWEHIEAFEQRYPMDARQMLTTDIVVLQGLAFLFNKKETWVRGHLYIQHVTRPDSRWLLEGIHPEIDAAEELDADETPVSPNLAIMGEELGMLTVVAGAFQAWDVCDDIQKIVTEQGNF